MASTSEAPPAAPARRAPGAWVLFVGVFIVGVVADLWTKAAVFAWVTRVEPATGSRAIVDGVLNFTLSTNPGVVFGVDWLPDWTVVAATVAAVGVVLYFFCTSPAAARWTHAALAMILGGAVGNLYDRLFTRVLLPGRVEPNIREVRDFIDFSPLHIGPLNYPWVFNIADVLLVIGVGILMIVSLRQWRLECKQAREARDAKS